MAILFNSPFQKKKSLEHIGRKTCLEYIGENNVEHEKRGRATSLKETNRHDPASCVHAMKRYANEGYCVLSPANGVGNKMQASAGCTRAVKATLSNDVMLAED